MEPNFPSSGGSTLAVRGLNVLHKLRSTRRTYAWSNLTPSCIADSFNNLPASPDDKNQKKFPLPVETLCNQQNNETPIEYIVQSNQYDIEFLLALARQVGYVVFVKEEEKVGNQVKPRRLYFGPSDANHPGLRLVTFELKWGHSLIDFKPTLTTANQIRTVTVNGWDRNQKQPIRASVSVDQLQLNGDLLDNLEACDAREERVEDEPVFTTDQAKKRAMYLLKQRSVDLVKASGTCVGLPALRAGQKVIIGNLGSRFSGTYFVTDTTHAISDSGYSTKFNARRENPDKEQP